MFLIKRSELKEEKIEKEPGKKFVFKNVKNKNERKELYECEFCFFWLARGCRKEGTCEAMPLEFFNYLEPFQAILRKRRF